MTADPSSRQYWRLNWLSCLNEFADVELQRRTWLDLTNLNPHWSYVEFMCTYFDNVICERTYAELVSEGLVSAAEAALVEPLHALLDKHEARDDTNAARVLADPAWLAITAEARATSTRLARLLTDPQERQALLEPIRPPS